MLAMRSGRPPGSLATTRSLIRRTRAGDAAARERLFDRFVRRLRRLAHGRLPFAARDVSDTMDVAQDAAVGLLRNLDRIDVGRSEGLESYIRRAVQNRIIDEVRRLHTTVPAGQLPPDSDVADSRPSALDQLISTQAWRRYRAALAQLPPVDREAIVARFEMGYSHAQVAALLGKPSAEAARMAVNRALQHLVSRMDRPTG